MPQLEKVLYSGYITQGAKVREFEEVLGCYFGTPNVLTVNSGTSALQLALRLAGVRGGEVVTTPMTCSATVLPVLTEGARPVWADTDPASGNIDPEDVTRKITPRTKAILAVHWGGQPCEMDSLLATAQDNGIPVIVDAAHALGAKWHSADIALQADFTCYSLQAIKHITTGDGGILVTRNPDDRARGERLRWFGIDRNAASTDARVDNDIPEPGYKFHMNDVTAVIGIAQMPYLDTVLEKHRENAAFYDREFAGITQRQYVPEQATGSWWLYTLLLKDNEERQKFAEFMNTKGIQVSRVHARLDGLTCFKDFAEAALPGTDEFFSRETCIPVHWGLSGSERAYTAASVKEFFS